MDKLLYHTRKGVQMLKWRSSGASFLEGKTELWFRVEGQELTNRQLTYLTREAIEHLNTYLGEVPTEKELEKNDPDWQ